MPLKTRLAVLLVLGTAAAIGSTAAAGPPVRGEMARLQRQVYDWAYRNSNENVFRNSRHYHPTRNAFRSSEYYKRRLAASFDGYPLRTVETVRRSIGDQEFTETIEYVHPRRHPAGPSPSEPPYGYVDPYLDGFPDEIVDAQFAAIDAPETITEEQTRIRSRADLDMIPVRPIEVIERPRREATIHREVLADGTTRVVISNE